ncbi:hypothetical protein Clacol_003919 [Clathrus columnatus]|uniref:Uncharacterized protein n=1 Tax=Clathrus columnatus TaxID=1419009 RepID=A0AAV5A9W6_9AGAM|nr:hypothetical protein Clacol_003919 [Clathrus columnatus]
MSVYVITHRVMFTVLLFLGLIALVGGYDVPVSDKDLDRQVCSGMWGGENAYINVTFESHSQGQLSMVIYEWNDVLYLGKQSSQSDDTLPKTYICTDDALNKGLCPSSDLGHFILDLPAGKSMNDTSFWSARLAFEPSTATANATNTFWNNPQGNPTPPKSEFDNPWRMARRQSLNSRENHLPFITLYQGPIKYDVPKTGYYCIAIIPLTVDAALNSRSASTPHPEYDGTILFHNVFTGKLPASDYPKVNFYLAIFLTYAVLGGLWAALCFRYREELLPVQYYISGLVGFLIIENMASFGPSLWRLAYYRYLNARGPGAGATAFLFVVSILDAGRNALSFFLLLIVSLGLSIVRESLGKAMLRCRILTAAHFIFGVLYSVGIVELELESTSALILLLFVIPLAFTLSGFMLWIMYALNGTIAELQTRKQYYKLSMFKRLYYVLIGTTLCILGFFVISSLQFSNRLAEGKSRLPLCFGQLRISGVQRNIIEDKCKLAQDENSAEDYEFDSLQRHDDEEEGIGRAHGPRDTVRADSVVFEIGDQDSDDEESQKRPHRAIRLSNDDERTAFINGNSNARKRD